MKPRIPTFIWQITQRIFCKGSADYAINPDPPPRPNEGWPFLTPAQDEWMRTNKPLYYTGIALSDLPHIPQHLRFV